MNLLHKFHHWRRKQRWNRQYKSGRWDSLKKPIEAGRYQRIVGYFEQFGSSSPGILDLGCGNGVLNSYLDEASFSRFLGVDFSKASIEKAKAMNFPKSQFEVGDIINFVPSECFDIIVFNEVFYYIPDSKKGVVLQRMLDHLNPNGLLITSIYREGLGCWEFFKENLSLVEEAFSTVTTDQEQTYWKIGAYRKAK